MRNKKLTMIIITSIIIVSLTGCNKDKSTLDINLPENSTTPIESTESLVESESESIEDTQSTESESDVKEPEESASSAYKDLNSKKKTLEEFLNQLKYLQEDNLDEMYSKYELGTNIETIVDDLESERFRYINNVVLDYLYDESGNVINMKQRKGLIVFSGSDFSTNEEAQLLSTKENYKKVNNKDVVINLNNCNFDSYVAYTFNNEGLLIGKFKYLLTEEEGKKVDISKINGSLNFDEKVSLEISETASVIDVYEKMDTVKSLIEEYEVNINSSFTECYTSFKRIYDVMTDVNSANDLAKMVTESELGIEQMPASALEKYNKKYLKNYSTGYYVYMTLSEDKTSPDLRYDKNYIVVIFDNNDKMYYAEIVSDTYNDIKCKDEKSASDYSLTDLYKSIAANDKTLANYSSEKDQFYEYLEENLDLLNKRVTFDMTKTAILAEIDESGLDYEQNYETLIVNNVKNQAGASISIKDEYGEKLYDDCIKVTSGPRSILYYFKGESLFGIYRTDYMDALKVKLEDYYSLKVIKKGLSQLISKETEVLEERQSYLNMVNKKLSDFMDLIGYGANHTQNQIYTKGDIIKALNTSGFKYEEGMNKGDGLYYIGIFALNTDTKFAYKIYFNESLQVELIQ